MTQRELVVRWSKAEKAARRLSRRAQGNVYAYFGLAYAEQKDGNRAGAEFWALEAERVAQSQKRTA